MLIALFWHSETIDTYVLLILALMLLSLHGIFRTLNAPLHPIFGQQTAGFAASLFKKTLIFMTLFVLIIQSLQIHDCIAAISLTRMTTCGPLVSANAYCLVLRYLHRHRWNFGGAGTS